MAEAFWGESDKARREISAVTAPVRVKLVCSNVLDARDQLIGAPTMDRRRIYSSEEVAFMRRAQAQLERELRLTTEYERAELAGILLAETDLTTKAPNAIRSAVRARYARVAPLAGPLFH